MNIQLKSTLTFLAGVSLAAVLSTPLGGCKSKEPSDGTPAGSSPKGAPSQTGTRVEVAAVTSQKSTTRIIRPGEIAGAREANLGAALGGFVEKVVVTTGKTVRKNAPLIYVDTSTHAAQARLTKVEVEEAQRELARMKGLGKAIASARVDAAVSRVARARAQHSLSITRQSRAVIRAPFAGVVVGLDVERGEVLAPGAPVARLVQLDPLHVKVSVADRDVVALKLGGKANVSTSAVGNQVSGEIARIEPAANLSTRTFTVEVAIPNPDRRLLPGMIAQVEFTSQRNGDAMFIPQDLLITRREGNGVFVVDGKRAKWRPVVLGGIAGTDVEISSGLRSGESIVVLGHRNLSDNDELIITRRGQCCVNGRVIYSAPSEIERPDAGGEPATAEPAAKDPEEAPTGQKKTTGKKKKAAGRANGASK